MQNNQENPLSPSHAAPVGRLTLEVINLKNPGLDASIIGGTMATLPPFTVGSFSDEE